MTLRIGFARPRLGIGGAERLVIDAARGLAARGHEIRLQAPDRRATPQFETALEPSIHWDPRFGFLPESVFGRFRAPAAILRTAVAALALRRFAPDVVIADVTAHAVPWIRRVVKAPAIFYCHFPDRLLTARGARESTLYAGYRTPLDGLEERGMERADAVIANSRFTARRAGELFRRLRSDLVVIEPGIDVDAFPDEPAHESGVISFCVISRIDPRKNLDLAVEAFASLRRTVEPSIETRLRLDIAGRHDPRWPENRATLDRLRSLAADLGCSDRVGFHLSPGDEDLRRLVSASRAVLHPSLDEHFGYGPLEAMASARPVIAVNRGGPSETVIDGVTGFLRDPDAARFAEAMARCAADASVASRLGLAGRDHVRRNFSADRMVARLESVCDRVVRDFRDQNPRV